MKKKSPPSRSSRARRTKVSPGPASAVTPPLTSALGADVAIPPLGRLLLDAALTDDSVLRATENTPDLSILPFANVIKIGGQSIIDRGRSGLMPVLDQIKANLNTHKMIIGTGAGTRARHVYSLGLDLSLPTGILSVLGTFVAMQNAHIVHFLLAEHGIPFIEPVQFIQLPLYLAARNAVVFFGMPPYNVWQQNPKVGRIPPHRTDTGIYLVSEVYGARSMIYIKDEDGLYTADPKKDRSATFIPRISVQELLEKDLPDLVVEHAVLEFMMNARHSTEIQIINGLKPGTLTRALNKEHVGTIIYRA